MCVIYLYVAISRNASHLNTAIVKAAIQEYASSTDLYLVPEQLNIPIMKSSGLDSFSAYGVTFDVPWRDVPLVSTSSPSGLLTLFYFADGQRIVEAFAPGTSVSGIAEGALTAYLAGLNRDGSSTFRMVSKSYEESLDSNFDFVSSSLNSTPYQLNLDTASLSDSVFKATGLLRTKDDIFRLLASDTLPTNAVSRFYFFSTPTIRGFQFSGTIIDGRRTLAVSHFLLFDEHNEPFDLLTVGATQMDDDIIISTLRLD
jgi:hypothetical protein